MNLYEHDGTVFDLDRSFLDVTGVKWGWTGEWNTAGEPMMRSFDRNTAHADGALSLPDLYHDHGPLIPLPFRPLASLKVAVLTEAVAS